MNLSEWVHNYLSFKYRLYSHVELDEKQDVVVVRYKSLGENHSDTYFYAEKIEELLLRNNFSDDREKIYFICKNTKQNVEILCQNWDGIIKNPKSIFIFVNLDLHSKWVVRPYSHNLITDRDNLKDGLMSLYRSSRDNT